MSAKKKARTRARAPTRGNAAAPLCRLVFVRPGTDGFRYGKWQRESARLHSRVAKFNAKPRQKFDVYIQVPPPATDCAQPTHIPAVGAKPGQWVYRYTFNDGGTGDLDRYKTELTLDKQRKDLRKAIEIERVTLSHAKYIQRDVSRAHGKRGGSEGGMKGGRPSIKPMRIDLQKDYQRHLIEHADADKARAEFVKELHGKTGKAVTTIRGWLRDAGI